MKKKNKRLPKPHKPIMIPYQRVTTNVCARHSAVFYHAFGPFSPAKVMIPLTTETMWKYWLAYYQLKSLDDYDTRHWSKARKERCRRRYMRSLKAVMTYHLSRIIGQTLMWSELKRNTLETQIDDIRDTFPNTDHGFMKFSQALIDAAEKLNKRKKRKTAYERNIR